MRNPFTIFTDTLHIGLSQSDIALVHSSGLLKKQNHVVKEHTFKQDTVENCLSDLSLFLVENQCQRLKTNIFLSNSWVRFFMVTPPSNASRFQDCQAAAEVRFSTLFGEAISTWEISADWQVKHPFLACAIPRALLTGLKRVADERHLSLLKIEPQLITYINCLRGKMSGNPWLGIFNDGNLDLVMFSGNRISRLHKCTYSDKETQDKNWLHDTIQREAFRHNSEIPTIFFYAGQPPKLWLDTESNAASNISYDSLDKLDKRFAQLTITTQSEAMRLANSWSKK
ncbi:hypothetical protein [Undibacterium flavidum]|uniref:Uncharacterized protein n=1 Tax=Undibacterium flavidum TaxID=2762297 RepID=A0ABR6YAR7_9BURK|nr:hypothetical protein [Undibacterium flavidum]MBC3873732.1 hypothetical protein [Undibacterium flavidum]